jgi:hypothetical protein
MSDMTNQNQLDADVEAALQGATTLRTAEHQLAEAERIVDERRTVVDGIHAEIRDTRAVIEEYGSRLDEATQDQMLAEISARRKVKRLQLDLQPAQVRIAASPGPDCGIVALVTP